MTLDRMLERGEGGGASLAQVSYSLAEGTWGAVADQEYRHRPVVSPGGYRWCPREEDQVLLLHTGDGDLCAGAAGDSRGLAPGEVEITGGGGGSIRLGADGSVVITGAGGGLIRLEPDGTVLINGQTFPAAAGEGGESDGPEGEL